MTTCVGRGVVALCLGALVVISIPGLATAADPGADALIAKPSRTPGGTGEAVARVEIRVPSGPRLVAAGLGISSDAIAELRSTPRAIATHTTPRQLGAKLVERGDVERKLPEYYARFDPEHGAFERDELIDDIALRTLIEADADAGIISVRTRATSMTDAKVMCRLIAEEFVNSCTNAHARRFQKARETAERMARDLRNDMAALDIQIENLIYNETLDGVDAAGSTQAALLRSLNERIVDLDVRLVGEPIVEAAQDVEVRKLVKQRDLLAVQRESARAQTANQAVNYARLRTIESDRAAKALLVASLQRAVLAYEEELSAPMPTIIDNEPVIEAR